MEIREADQGDSMSAQVFTKSCWDLCGQGSQHICSSAGQEPWEMSLHCRDPTLGSSEIAALPYCLWLTLRTQRSWRGEDTCSNLKGKSYPFVFILFEEPARGLGGEVVVGVCWVRRVTQTDLSFCPLQSTFAISILLFSRRTQPALAWLTPRLSCHVGAHVEKMTPFRKVKSRSRMRTTFVFLRIRISRERGEKLGQRIP